MRALTIYLLRESIATPEDAIAGAIRPEEVRAGTSLYGKIFVKAGRKKPPKWAPLFSPFVDEGSLGSVQSTAAAFITEAGGRLFALTFGQGRHLLHPDSYEERFGLVVTLNSIEYDALRSVDKRALLDDQNSRVQSSQAAAAPSFGLDIERDLVRGIVGKPTDPALGSRMSGADALTVATDVDIPGLRRLLRRYLRQYESKDYLDAFPWVDQVRQLIPKGATAQRLDEMLLEKLQIAWQNRGIVEGCWLSIPDIVDWNAVHGFKFTRQMRDGVLTDLHLPGAVLAHPDADLSIEFLKRHYAFSVNEEEQVVDKWPLYRCLHCEIALDGTTYILSSGRWFEVDTDFVKAVEEAFAAIPHYAEAFPIYNDTSENAYNERVARDSAGRWCLMDRKLLKVGGVHDKVEFCDLFGRGDIVHVKHYGSSAVLGHLFNQGMVSGELLRSQKGYLELANAQLSGDHQIELRGDELGIRDVSGLNVVFAVISQSLKDGLHLPFFAKVILKSVNARLIGLGFKGVQVCKISCHDNVRVQRLAAARPRTRRRPARKATSQAGGRRGR